MNKEEGCWTASSGKMGRCQETGQQILVSFIVLSICKHLSWFFWGFVITGHFPVSVPIINYLTLEYGIGAMMSIQEFFPTILSRWTLWVKPVVKSAMVTCSEDFNQGTEAAF